MKKYLNVGKKSGKKCIFELMGIEVMVEILMLYKRLLSLYG